MVIGLEIFALGKKNVSDSQSICKTVLQTPFLSLVKDDETTASVSGWITEQLLKIHEAEWE